MARKEPKYTNLPAKELPPYQLYKRWQKATGYSSMDRFGSLPREEALKAIGEASGKGWRENPDHTGKAPKHRKAALKAEGKGAINEPIGTKSRNPKCFECGGEIKGKVHWKRQKEPFSNPLLGGFFGDTAVCGKCAKGAVKEPIRTTQPHRKLTEKEMYRMINMHASAPLTYKSSIDDGLIKLGLIMFWDNTKDAVVSTDVPFYDRSGRILPEWYDFKELPQEIEDIKAHMQRVKETTLFEKWVAYLKRLDPHGRGFEVFDYNAGEESVSKLNEILKGGQQALDDYINELQEQNLEYQDEMFASSFKEFLKGEDIDRSTIENEDEFRIEFEGHVNYNVEKLFDYDVLLLEKKHYEVAYDGASSEINLTDTEATEFRKKALKYITEKQLNTILANSYGGVGYFGIIIHASEIIEATKKGEKSVSDNQLVVGIHDWMNGAGYFERATVKPNYEISLDNAMLDIDSYGIGAVFGTGEWKWR